LDWVWKIVPRLTLAGLRIISVQEFSHFPHFNSWLFCSC